MAVNGDDAGLPALYVVGTQEAVIPRDEWEAMLERALPGGYRKAYGQQLEGMMLCIFALADLLPQITELESADIPTKLGGMLKTKGAVGIALQCGGTSFLFVASHLAAHQTKVDDRNRDFAAICRGLPLPHREHQRESAGGDESMSSRRKSGGKRTI